MRVTVLGCSGSMSGPASVASSYLVRTGDTAVLIDLGPGAMGRLLAHENPANLSAIVLSHLHADHMVDMIGMHVYRRWCPSGALPPIPVIAPAGVADRVRGVGGDGADEKFEEFSFVEGKDAQVIEFGDLSIELFSVRHTVDAFSIRVTGPAEDDPARQVTLAYSGDTDSCERLVDSARDADMFICEAAFLEGRDSVRGVHLTAQRAGEAAKAAQARQLVLTHLPPWNDPGECVEEARTAYDGPILVAEADATYAL